MEALRENANILKSLRVDSNRRRSQSSNSSVSNDSTISDSTMNGMEDFKFTYEEESDPETFFIPYVWEAIVCTVTASSLEWDRMNIKAFAIIHHLSNSGGDDDELSVRNNWGNFDGRQNCDLYREELLKVIAKNLGSILFTSSCVNGHFILGSY
eukprot:scaffold535_cov225-Chaetoceros_neogracile.AAC.5